MGWLLYVARNNGVCPSRFGADAETPDDMNRRKHSTHPMAEARKIDPAWLGKYDHLLSKVA